MFKIARLRVLLLVGLLLIVTYLATMHVSAPTEEPVVLTRQRGSVALMVVGDIMLCRGVRRQIEKAGNPSLPFSQTRQLFSSVDFSFGNLETPVSGNDNILAKGLVFNTSRRDLIGLVQNKFKALSLANNHAMDQGPNGLKNTIASVRGLGIQTSGTGDDLDQAWQPHVVESNGTRIAFIAASYSSYNDGGVGHNDLVARIEDHNRLQGAIQSAKQQADVVIVMMHAGIEYTRRPETGQIDFAHTAIDDGADVVIGAHPHWAQTIETYKNRPIFYSLGNFIFDQPWPDTKEGLTLRIHISPDNGGSGARISSIDLVPIVIETMGVPRPATDLEKRSILNKIGADTDTMRFDQ